ncbi:hypothetical protein BKH43_06380 [Helicobacter sp. 13S00401-1]|uniref:hypothetical protein n=1 Tax=Helicobacter sp. 13S00401-1 TaxID=1905758 RepID=UPI000BA7930C|nr:hypothetical protein [Helicobacter sp. 13S00401-1]PAF49712.1 hypothetical protein BKH43_06380 [Helicobacter sp. 13S00401-1]
MTLALQTLIPPFQVGFYEKEGHSQNSKDISYKRLESFSFEGMLVHSLRALFGALLKQDYDKSFFDTKALRALSKLTTLDSILYARGVGNLSAMKLTHIALQTLHKTKDINIYAGDIFSFSQSKEIKAFGAMSYFLKEEEGLKSIVLEKSLSPSIEFYMPEILSLKDFKQPLEPLYITNYL